MMNDHKTAQTDFFWEKKIGKYDEVIETEKNVRCVKVVIRANNAAAEGEVE